MYVLGDGLSSATLHVQPCQSILEPYRLLRGEDYSQHPIVFEPRMGGVPRDFILTGYASLFLISPRVIDLLHKNEVTGWSTYPVEVTGKTGEPLNGYAGLSITGRCGPPDKPNVRKPWHDPPRWSENPYEWMRRPYFDPSTWDGSDMFVPTGTGHIILVDRVVTLLKRAKVTNARFELLMSVVR